MTDLPPPAYRSPVQPPHGWEGREAKHFDPPRKTAIPPRFASKVVGVGFAPGYPGNLRALAMLAGGDEEPRIVLRHNPDNPHDSNAVEVLAERPGGLRMLGHLPRAVAPRVAADLDAGRAWQVVSYEVLEDPRHLDKPGLSIDARRLDSEPAPRCGSCGCRPTEDGSDCPGGIQSDNADPCICHAIAADA